MSMESIYEYGSRAGVWRLLDLFRDRDVPLTLFAVAMAMQRHPAVIERALADGHEIASHGYRWINYHGMSPRSEADHMDRAIRIHTDICGERPLGWYTGRTSANTRVILSPPKVAFSMTPMIIPTICPSGVRRQAPRI